MEQQGSFASRVKEEIASFAFEDEQKRSLLSSFSKINGHIRFTDGKQLLELSSENSKIAKAIYSFIKTLYGVNASFAFTKGVNLKKRIKYHVLAEEPDYLLGDLEVDLFEERIPKNAVANDLLCEAYIVGAFLACGSVNDPRSSNYHLEFAFTNAEYAKWFSRILNKAQGGRFQSKVTSRRSQSVVYLKRSDQIADLLILMHATESCLEYEDVRVDRDFSNIGNRLQNLDGANLKKTMGAAERQVKEINYFISTYGWNWCASNPKLMMLMKLRLAHEDATLDELKELLSEELASAVSKSNVNHLFRYIHAEYVAEQDD